MQKRRRRFGRFFGALYLITGLANAPFAIGFAWALDRVGAPYSPVIAIAAAALMTLGLRGRLRRAIDDAPISAARRLFVEQPYFVHWCATFVSILAFTLGALILGARSIVTGAPFAIGPLAAASYLIGLLPAAWGVVVRRHWVRFREIDVAIPGLAKAFDGYRVAHLSDLHIGSMLPQSVRDAWVKRVNDLDVDLVALTGDYVTNGVRFHEDIAALLGKLRARDGAVAVMGNHDYFGDGEPLITLLRERGVAVLRNARSSLSRDGATLTIAGVDDTWTGRADVELTMRGAPRGPILALAHDPQLFPALAARGASLVLAGHTHWGQVAVPFAAERYNLSRMTYRFNAGRYELDGATLYISPGLGTTGPPVRLGVAPEITVLRLRALDD